MTHDEKLDQLRKDLARQDAALAQAREQLESLGDIHFDVPKEWLRELEEACAPAGIIPTALVVGIRG